MRPFDLHGEDVRVDQALRTGDVVDAIGGLEVIHTPGHTPGHISLYSKSRRLLFAGDAVLNVLGLRPPYYGTTWDMVVAKRSIGSLAQLDFDIALPGHGSPIINRANEKIADWYDRWLRDDVEREERPCRT
jgi:glyoxylase-like metal-dependent hydrolase (beta-lactamase superfamily II)